MNSVDPTARQNMDMPTQSELAKLFGVRYFDESETAIVEARDSDLYWYKSFVGQHTVDIEKGDCVYWLSDDRKTANLTRGPAQIKSKHIATIIRGYMPENKTSGVETSTILPYVNGCSSKQIFPPDRLGDPTLQMLNLPPYTAEQVHHIHSTVRVVHVLKGRGWSVVGMDKLTIREELYPGKSLILDPMCPHHFETLDEPLLVMPLHVFSSVPGIEKNHPMFNGTHEI